ncbi:MAG TPA: hypothetical protein VMB21_11885 [Candidatus Limnocylindria bacterium]|jgi:hypothetical protein|nr:hypothetical protein [Candidatus Limnocylindria bacterium]
MRTAFFQRVPGWLWLGWSVHLVAYALPSYRIGANETALGLKCAHVVFQMWFSEEGLLAELKKGQMDSIRGEAILGWFNVTNLAALLAPWLLCRFRRPSVAWWVGLLCLTGAAQAFAFGMGMITGAREFDSLRLGFYVWLFSYLWLAVGAFVVWRRLCTTMTPIGPEAGPVGPRS